MKFKTLAGENFEFPIDPKTTIEEVKNLMREKLGWDCKIKFSFKAKSLDDKQKIGSLKLTPDDYIVVYRKLLKNPLPTPKQDEDETQSDESEQKPKRNSQITDEMICNVTEFTGVSESVAEAALVEYHFNVEVAIIHIVDGTFKIKSSDNDEPKKHSDHEAFDKHSPKEKDEAAELCKNVIEFTGVSESVAKAALAEYHFNVEVAINHIVDGTFKIH